MIACYILHSTLPDNFMLALLTKVQEPGYQCIIMLPTVIILLRGGMIGKYT